MSDELRETDCAEYADELAELALGVLTGRDRVRVLSHVDACPRCTDELEQLSRVADAVVQMAPAVEPPVGFEVRLLERMGVADERRHRRRIRPSTWVPAGVAAAAAAVALGLGLGLSSSPAPTVSAHAGTPHQLSADLVEDGSTVGHVMTFGGDKPWMWMTLTDSAARGTVTCAVVTADGVRHRVGSFDTSQGYGTWAAPLHVNPAQVRTAEVVSPSGTVIATASLG